MYGDKVWGKEKEIFVLKVVISQWKRKKTRDKLKMGTDNWKRCVKKSVFGKELDPWSGLEKMRVDSKTEMSFRINMKPVQT